VLDCGLRLTCGAKSMGTLPTDEIVAGSANRNGAPRKLTRDIDRGEEAHLG